MSVNKKDKKIFNEVIDTLYFHYEALHSLKTVAYYHSTPFQTYSIGISKEPELLMNKDEFIEKFNKKDDNNKWSFAAEVLFGYISRKQHNHLYKTKQFLYKTKQSFKRR